MDDVADQVVLALAKFTSSLSPAVMRPRVVFGRDFKACAASEALFHVVNRCGARGCGGGNRKGEGSKLCTASEASVHVDMCSGGEYTAGPLLLDVCAGLSVIGGWVLDKSCYAQVFIAEN